MKLTKSFEQSVGVMAILATQVKGVPIASSTIHTRLRTSLTYGQKIIRKLVKAGLVASVSGQNGGFCLAKEAQDISCLDVVEAVEGPVQTFRNEKLLDRVFNDGDKQTVKEADETLKEIFNEADEQWCNYLRKISIEDIITRVLGNEDYHEIDWNQVSSSRELLLSKILRSGR